MIHSIRSAVFQLSTRIQQVEGFIQFDYVELQICQECLSRLWVAVAALEYTSREDYRMGNLSTMRSLSYKPFATMTLANEHDCVRSIL
jgi:hypothetical protein